jgi:hypothetical protein
MFARSYLKSPSWSRFYINMCKAQSDEDLNLGQMEMSPAPLSHFLFLLIVNALISRSLRIRCQGRVMYDCNIGII